MIDEVSVSGASTPGLTATHRWKRVPFLTVFTRALAVFRYYDQPAAISTELSFPCAGTGSVVFKPVFAGPKPRNGGPNARSAVVRVYFEGQP